jgi:3-hydroxymyristoyl/3-hydroxydecanoyl-(acyl carrier protein) dehydratase
MDESFRAFSFVDRILSCEAGVRIRGRYGIPAGIEAFPASLVAEAVGQLAALSAMAAVDFQRRPVAGIAGGIELLGEVRPGQTLELAADLESADLEAVAYGGSASVDGVPVLRLTHCVGPMVSMEEFDDPVAVRARFGVLSAEGARPGGFAGLPPLIVERTGGESGKVARATLCVPASARIFADHFPRRPVFPGSLLMHANLELAAHLVNEITVPEPQVGRDSVEPKLPLVASEPSAGNSGSSRMVGTSSALLNVSPGGTGSIRPVQGSTESRPTRCVAIWRPRAISDMKLRAFIPPGETLDLEARLVDCSERVADLLVETRRGKRLLGSARVKFVSEGPL